MSTGSGTPLNRAKKEQRISGFAKMLTTTLKTETENSSVAAVSANVTSKISKSKLDEFDKSHLLALEKYDNENQMFRIET